MTALNFPASPSVGQTYTANNKTWMWDGSSWNSYNQITVAPTNNGSPISGTSYRSIGDMFGDYLSVRDFGAYNDGTHATETTAAFQAALNASNYVYVPAGNYLLNANISKTITNSNFSLLGAGMGVSNLIFSGNTGLVLTLSGTGPKIIDSTVEKLTFLANQTGGTAIIATRDLGSPIEQGLTFNEIECVGYAGVHNSSQYWYRGIHLADVRFVRFDNCRLWGKDGNNGSGASAAGIHITGVMSTGNEMFGFVGTGNWITNWDYGFYANANIEGIYWFGGEIWGCTTPFFANRDASLAPAGVARITSCHLNGASHVVQIQNFTAVGISNCDVYHGTDYGTPASSNMLWLTNCSQAQITGNKIETAFSVPTNGVVLGGCAGVTVSGNGIYRIPNNAIFAYSTSRNIMVDGNDIDGLTATTSAGIVFDSTTTTSTAGVNNFRNVTTPITDANGSAHVSPPQYVMSHVATVGSGTSPVETFSVAIPSDVFSAKPKFVSITPASGNQYIYSYDYGDAATTATNLRITIRDITGTNIPSGGLFRMSILAMQSP